MFLSVIVLLSLCCSSEVSCN